MTALAFGECNSISFRKNLFSELKVWDTSNSEAGSRKTRRLWMRLVGEGYAEFIGDAVSTYRFVPAVLKSNPELDAIYLCYRSKIQE